MHSFFQASDKLKDFLNTQSSLNPESRLYGKSFSTFLQNFPDKSQQDLAKGTHSLKQAADIVGKSEIFDGPLAAQGAVQCLAKMVSLTCLFVLLE
jgi:hypothetical protein